MSSLNINDNKDLQSQLEACENVYYNLGEAQLYEHALKFEDAELTAFGALSVNTGKHTGRSAQDKFIVLDAQTQDKVWWDQNKSITPAHFNRLNADIEQHMNAHSLYGGRLYVTELLAGADSQYGLKVRIITETAWHALFIRNMLIAPEKADLVDFAPDLTIIDLPSFKADVNVHGCRSETIIACDFSHGRVLIGGTSYAGEIKKSVFTAMNFLLPEEGVLPMHCSANIGENGDTALFFGLSGTGKTTLSADPKRALIGDDEHGWSPNGIFNIEGGCYAKTDGLSADKEPEIFKATQQFGAVLENVVLNPGSRVPDFDDISLTPNARCAYGLDKIDNVAPDAKGGHPKNIVMLAADAFGVLPPLAKLTPDQAQYYFLSGYTAKLAGTEKGVSEPTPVFSACFGAPFMPLQPTLYAQMLAKLIEDHGAHVWLLNTGWSGGGVGVGERMALKTTRGLLSAALDGALAHTDFVTDPYFGLQVPQSVPNIDAAILMPQNSWADKDAYADAAKKLVGMFEDNFKNFDQKVSAAILEAAPKILAA